MKQIVLGTAGHIDHGKTSLVKALTGVDTDRLKEEKERGITIELGFTYLELPGGKLIGIVDVPGHEKFVKNMVAGATGIDLVALVIAADEGVMPQTREHIEICELLKIRHGLVVLTKIDMVEPDWLELVREDVTEYLADTFLAGSPVLEVSSTTGKGIDELLKTLEGLVQEIPEREAGNFFRLPVDRVFTIKGFGTVITGTTVSGHISTGDEVTVYPQEIQSKIRGIQVHGKEVEEVRAGLRTAINLQGVDKAIIRRGDVLATKASLRPTYMVDVILELLPSAPRKLKNRTKARFHSGTSEIISTVVLLDRDELLPGETCFAQIRLDEPIAILKQDRYVLRSYSPVRTIGGGEVLNPLPKKKKRFSDAAISELKTLYTGDIVNVIEQFIYSGGFRGVSHDDLIFLANVGKKRLASVLKDLMAKKIAVQFDKERGLLIHKTFLDKARTELVETIRQYHENFPLRPGLVKEELRSKIKGANNPKMFNFLVNMLRHDGMIILEKEIVRLKDHRVTLALDQEKARQRLENIYLKSGLEPHYFKEIKDTLPVDTATEVLEVLLRDGVLLKIKEDMFFHREILERLQAKLTAFLEEHGEITTPQFKEMTGVSRKYAIPLIEYLDRAQVTVRVGDSRVLRKK